MSETWRLENLTYVAVVYERQILTSNVGLRAERVNGNKGLSFACTRNLLINEEIIIWSKE